jgi:hypothetical protein
MLALRRAGGSIVLTHQSHPVLWPQFFQLAISWMSDVIMVVVRRKTHAITQDVMMILHDA